MYSCGPPHMDVQKQDDQHELTYSNYVRTWDVTLKTCRRRWMIGRSGQRGSRISVLAARHDDDDDVCKYIYIYIYIGWLSSRFRSWPPPLSHVLSLPLPPPLKWYVFIVDSSGHPNCDRFCHRIGTTDQFCLPWHYLCAR